MCCLLIIALMWKNILCVTEAFKTLLSGYVKYKITFPFQYNGILSGIMKDNFSFSNFSTLLKKWNFLLMTETIANTSLGMKITLRLDNSAKYIVNRADNSS